MFEPTENQRRSVRGLSGYGVPQNGIAIHIGIDAKSLGSISGTNLIGDRLKRPRKSRRRRFTWPRSRRTYHR